MQGIAHPQTRRGNVPLRLGAVAVCGLVAISETEADALLTEWGHYLGPCDRPFRNEAWALDVMGEPVSVAVTSSIVSTTVAGYPRKQVVELSRLASLERWATRVTLRLWREVAAPRYLPWTPTAAVAYSKNDRHEGRIYRFDGWDKITDTAGSNGGGTWTKPRTAGDQAAGQKTLWLWKYGQ
jgi:hypothetical protein